MPFKFIHQFSLPMLWKHPGHVPQNIINLKCFHFRSAGLQFGLDSNSHRRGGAQNTKSLQILTDRWNYRHQATCCTCDLPYTVQTSWMMKMIMMMMTNMNIMLMTRITMVKKMIFIHSAYELRELWWPFIFAGKDVTGHQTSAAMSLC